jgi:hypothetical protein
MNAGWTRWFDRWSGRGDLAVSVPSMDGALRPNSRLDKLATFAQLPQADSLVSCGELLLACSDCDLLVYRDGAPRPDLMRRYPAPISALAAGADGLLAVGLEDGTLVLREGQGEVQRRLRIEAPGAARSPTAMVFGPDGQLYLTVGSASVVASRWKRDLMALGASGSVLRLDLASGRWSCLADGLAYPSGLAFDAAGDVVFAEAWRHRLVALRKGRREVLLDDLPGYPGRLSPAAHGGFWLAAFAPRSQMVEFVLRERSYCERMMARMRSGVRCAVITVALTAAAMGSPAARSIAVGW